MMNLLRRFADIFRIDSIDMNALTGKARMEYSLRSEGITLKSQNMFPTLRRHCFKITKYVPYALKALL
jgi:hypothetical protein